MDIWQPGDERPDLSGGYSFEWTIQLQNGEEYWVHSANRDECLILPNGEKVEFLFALTKEREHIFTTGESN